MSETQALPVATTPEASSTEPAANEVEAVAADSEGEAKPQEAAEDKPAEEAKPEKTPEQREIERMRRKIDRLVRQREELRARVSGDLTREPQGEHNQDSASDSEQLTLSRAELSALIEARAKQVAPVIGQQQAAIEHRQRIVGRLAATWGQEKFDALASDLNDAFDGLRVGGILDNTGPVKPAAEAIFEADDPQQLIEYLADPENQADAERIARMSAVQAGRAIAKLEVQLAERKAKAAPKASQVPEPLPKEKGSGPATPKRLVDLADDYEAFVKRRNAQIAQRR